MKRKFLSILLTLAMALTLLPVSAMAEETPVEAPAETKVAQIGDVKYDTLQAAVDAANDGDTITLLKSGNGNGVSVPANKFINKGVTVNFNGYTYMVGGQLVGSAGTGTNAFQLNAGNKLTFKNGSIVGATEGSKPADDTPNWHGAPAIVIQNYCDLTLDNMTVTGGDETVYTMSNNCGNVVIKDTVINPGMAKGYGYGPYAFDVYGGFQSYGDVTVTVEGVSVINGNIEIDHGTDNNNVNTLIVKAGTVNGNIKKTNGNLTITGGTFTSDVSAYVPDRYIYNSETKTVEPLGETNSVAKIGENYYKTLAEAINAASNGATITLLKDAETTVELSFTSKAITLDLNGKTVSGTFTDHFSVIEAGEDASLTVQDTSDAGTGKIASNEYGISARDGGTLIVKSGTIESEYAPLSGNNTAGNMNFTVNGGTLTAKSGPAIYMPGQVSLTITDGVLNGGISLRMGQVNISGGTINAITTGIDMPTDTLSGKPAYAYSGNVWFPDALYVIGGTYTSTDATYGNSLKMNITGGTFNCTNGKGSAVAIYDLGKVAQTANVTISGDAKFATNSAERNAYQVVSFADMNATPITGYGNTEMVGKVASAITGGLFSSKPAKEYIANGYYVNASNNGEYPYIVNDKDPGNTTLVVVKDVAPDTAIAEGIKQADKDAIDLVKGKTSVQGVGTAVSDKKDTLVKNSDVKTEGATEVKVEVKVNVNVTKADLTAGTMTFEAKPVATVTTTKADGTQLDKKENVEVPNTLLNGGEITVKLPLPANFTPEQIKHISSDGSVEYFLKTAKRGAKTFEIKDGCAVFTITKFSTFELSGTVTYVEPSSGGGSSSSSRRYDVSAPSVKHGDVTVSPKSASKGDTVTVTVKPDSGYVLETLTVTDKNGNELTLKDKGNGKYTFTMPAGKVEAKATFMEDNSMLNFFYDVPNGAYFYEAVKWAVENGITTGVGNDLFAPEQPCTRAQIVTFLWRAAGSPEPKGTAAGMTDVVPGSYYAKAVAWAVENGITTGTAEGTFSPDATCTRAQAVTFLARAQNAKATGKTAFSDVPADSYFADAVAWAQANGVTTGTSETTFSPDSDCTRAQIVTFLYRANQGT